MRSTFYIKADYENEKLTLDIEGQTGVEYIPRFKKCRSAVLSKLPLEVENLVSVTVDSDAGEVRLNYRIDPQQLDGEAILLALGMTRVDTSYTVDLFRRLSTRNRKAKQQDAPNQSATE